ncbi:MAG: ABC transporter involved in cytochrome c biogenesis, ATPase component CcmA [uncultured Sphingosinicella sp.]|uniref:ABC transporter involved in cytochrome c biogenesis, ATPase component CcmA n=1 Tax=uncultured Sphingosinicella sp. TaxID=478748 RepID=A0A6J4U9G6_9SPHN|nr:heme ABC exporter ATP-binding protein CcmA [uncultured Sphingosinicella sp.]CAA9544594.1 MAG: ABC transporter involved in cytochrome c biogenesis, ATPase component CcmA [uncultured Sphingosinicella sp.]
MSALLELRDVALIRGGRLLFEGVSLSLEPGGSAIISGPNGVGKSSLMRVAAGLLRATVGEVKRHSPAALADEAAALDERLTLGRALAFWARLDSVRAEAGMEPMGIAHLANVPVRMLSTGQRKRATLARVIVSGAPLWLLDEPANGLDAEGQERLTAAMAAHRSRGGAVLAATHQPIGLESAATLALGAA